AAGQDAFFLTRSQQVEILAGVYQRGVRTFAEWGDEAVGGQLLAGAGAGRFAGQCSFQGLGIESEIGIEPVNEQVAEPHGGEDLQKTQSGHYSRPPRAGQPWRVSTVDESSKQRKFPKALEHLQNFFHIGLAKVIRAL